MEGSLPRSGKFLDERIGSMPELELVLMAAMKDLGVHEERIGNARTLGQHGDIPQDVAGHQFKEGRSQLIVPVFPGDAECSRDGCIVSDHRKK
ncbi:MAG: hypothetical protein UY19_C0011G0045 [Candidatus Wolfebacteria bacterium GW2011_GWA2_47_9b]|uniref:Uncharacterized protein n=1 Tax=Candidatus Wolfebacteria bacterium GW2011_GWA2_47_9b TaxID=1619005 RepID=A0A0G1X5G3_9BACT|nr:MAG: hypothetical protein UX76_C0011G0009 [Candidatus Wolfebacteria bacterium GW2011_GWC1_47_103]KKU89640.1 MAG: hypothetical protein UY19_C0011G0045 [Candidatus Wolfebacteria bacterium GW2011_GWA2_47_9b]